MKKEIIISAKNLGDLAKPNFCPRCFWLKHQIGPHNVPFQIHAGIFSTIDSFTKNTTHKYFDEKNSLPSYLTELGQIKKYINPPHWTKFSFKDLESGITVRGSADGIYQKTDDSYIIVDFKTATYTKGQDALFSSYEIQLNAYAYIGENTGLYPVDDLALIYMDPTCLDTNTLADFCAEKGMLMLFNPKIIRVKKDYSKLKQLLVNARKICDLDTPPHSNLDCKDCERLQTVFETLHQDRNTSLESSFKAVDTGHTNFLGDMPELQLSSRHENRKTNSN